MRLSRLFATTKLDFCNGQRFVDGRVDKRWNWGNSNTEIKRKKKRFGRQNKTTYHTLGNGQKTKKTNAPQSLQQHPTHPPDAVSIPSAPKRQYATDVRTQSIPLSPVAMVACQIVEGRDPFANTPCPGLDLYLAFTALWIWIGRLSLQHQTLTRWSSACAGLWLGTAARILSSCVRCPRPQRG